MNIIIRQYVEGLDKDLRQYRTMIQRAFARKFTRPRDCSQYFFETLVSTSGLYRDYLNLKKLGPTILRDLRAEVNETIRLVTDSRQGIEQQLKMRGRFSGKIESLPCWSQFCARNEFATENHLRVKVDYINSLVLHLPEIYSETIRASVIVRTIAKERAVSEVNLGALLVSLEHVAHHTSYSFHTLEILSLEESWQPIEL